MFAYGDDQHAFPNLFLVHDVVTDAAVLRDAPGNESRDNQRNDPARRREPSRLEPRLPPTSWLFRQPWCNFLPDLPPVICSRIRHRQRIQRREHCLDSLHLGAALFAGRQMIRYHCAPLGNSLTICNQFFFPHVSHDSVPIARACAFVSTNGCSA